MSQELAVLRENRNSLAVQHGLPPIGAAMSNQHGIVWRVDGHFFAPTLATIARGPVVADNPRDLFPVLHPQNLSPRLLEFIGETDRCTSKQFLLLDTLPHLRPGEAHPDGHWVDAWSNPSFIPVFLDAAHAHETIIAHEIGHVWIDLVYDCEDYRVLRDLSDTAKAHQWTSIQSFVLDKKVNEVLRQKGFDTSLLDAQQNEALASLACALQAGYQPPSQAEAAFLAIHVATTMLDGETAANDALQCFDMATLEIECHLPDVHDLACQMAASVRQYGCCDRASIRRSIDACAALSFAFTGQPFDAEQDLIEEQPEECFADKYPQCFAGLPVQAKLEIGRIMAKRGLPAGTECRLSSSPVGNVRIEFCDKAGTWTGPIPLHYAPCLPHDISARVRPMPERQSHMKQPTTFTPQSRTPPSVSSPALPSFPSLPSITPHLPGTGLSASRRHYNTGTALFLTRVRLWEQIGGEHPYAYAMNNPTTYIDPEGDKPKKPPHGKKQHQHTSRVGKNGCTEQQTAQILKAISDICRVRIPLMTDPKARDYATRICNGHISVFCHTQKDPLCNVNASSYPGYTPLPGQPASGTACSYSQKPSQEPPTINLCPTAFNSTKCGCLGTSILWEMMNDSDQTPRNSDSTLCLLAEKAYGKGTPPCP